MDLGEDVEDKNYFVRMFPDYRQRIYARFPCTSERWKNTGTVVLSSLYTKNTYLGIDIRLRRTTAHPFGPGFTREGVRFNWEQANVFYKTLGNLLSLIEKEIEVGNILLPDEEE